MVSKTEGHKPGTFDKYYAPYVQRDAVIVHASLVTPNFTKGYVKLPSKDHADKPLIEPKTFQDTHAVERLIGCIPST